jgi:hypothetical protein
MVANRCVTKAVLAPIRAAALAASQPAWPPPMTMTSNDVGVEIMADFYPQTITSGSRILVSGVFHVKQRLPAARSTATPTVLFYVKQPHAKELARQPLFHVKQDLRMNKEMN